MLAMTWTLTQSHAEAWLAALPSEQADALITDPPYSSGGTSVTARKGTSTNSKYIDDKNRYPEFYGDSRDQRSWTQWTAWWLLAGFQAVRPGGVCAVFTDWRMLPSLSDAMQMAGWLTRGVIVWDKTGAARPVLGRPTNQAEYILWGSKGALNTDRRCNTDSGILPGVLRHRVDSRNDKHHTTGKPTPLMLDLVRIAEKGDTIIDPFAGSGTTGVAAVKLGYEFHGCELSSEYARIATERIADAAATFRAKSGGQMTLGATRPQSLRDP